MNRTLPRADILYDLLVVGGGITGAGVALDAAQRGHRVALVDKGDLASGTSSASTKLIHGGLRYLEHGGFGLVAEALRERRLLLRNAPHLVRPLRFVIPFYEGARVRPWKFRLGLTLYDLLAGRQNLQRSRPVAARHLLREFPGLRARGLRGGATYFDAQMDDARLCLAVHRSASQAGVHAANYVEVVGFDTAGGAIRAAYAVDRVTGAALTLRARVVLNAAGPWADGVCRLAGDAGEPLLRPTKGVHLLAPGRGLTAAFLLLHPADGRVFFVIPWLGKTLVGTTDTPAEGAADSLTVTADEARYLREGLNYYFDPPLRETEVFSYFAGLRPLIRARPGEPAALTREYRVFTSPSGLLSVAGGKYTTYRHTAQVVTDEVGRRLGRRRPTRTHTCRLDGAPGGAWEEFVASESARLLYEDDERNATRVFHLINRYGTRARAVARACRARPGLLRPVLPGEPDLLGEFVYQRAEEMALFPADHLLRRTRLGLLAPELLRQPWPLDLGVT